MLRRAAKKVLKRFFRGSVERAKRDDAFWAEAKCRGRGATVLGPRSTAHPETSDGTSLFSIIMHCRVLTTSDEENQRFKNSRNGFLKKAFKKAWKRMRGSSEGTLGTDSEDFQFEDRYSEFEESESPPRYRPDSLKALCRATKFTEAEIKRIYRGFKAECPTGVVREETFKGIYSQFFPQGANASQYAHYVFNTLDHNRSGILSFEDFVTGLSILARGTLEEKLKWTFSLYDINGDGCITKDEMTDIITAIYDLMGKHIEPIDEATLKDRVDRIFEKMDMNQDGVVTMEEFLDCCTTDDDISSSMDVFDFSF